MIASITKNLEYQCSGYNLAVKFIKKYYKNIVKNEVSVSDIKPSDRVLCIGGGSVPCTAILISKLTDANVEVVDVDRKAVRRAQNLISRLGLSNKINVSYGDGTSIDCSDFDVVHIALQVQPKESVIKNAAETCKKGKKIIVRMPKDCLKGFYGNFRKDSICSEGMNVLTKTFTSKFNTMKEVLIIEKTANS